MEVTFPLALFFPSLFPSIFPSLSVPSILFLFWNCDLLHSCSLDLGHILEPDRLRPSDMFCGNVFADSWSVPTSFQASEKTIGVLREVGRDWDLGVCVFVCVGREGGLDGWICMWARL